MIGRLADLFSTDEVAIAEPVRLEVLFSARSAQEYDAISWELDGLEPAPCGNSELRRALEVQRLLAHKAGLHHRSVRIPDLLVAATAELAGLTVLHYDEDYERVSAVTGQSTEWIVPRGSID
ncbi:MAG TPA: PIN domain nuclease [Acidimicrobiia bacterium]|nr:PIN domain nuclease [Acidimicrobiia bacterium]